MRRRNHETRRRKKRFDKMIMAAYNMGEGSLATAGGKGSTAGSVDLTFITLTEPEVPMKRIKLTQGKVALVDDEDYEWLNQWKWYASEGRNTFYAFRTGQVCGKNTAIQMHREILGLTLYDGKHTDHIDHNGLNNLKSNLRICTTQQNHYNQNPRKGTSRFKGVCWRKKLKKWSAQIQYKNRQTFLGYFLKEINAALAYDAKARELFGEFAKPNFRERT